MFFQIVTRSFPTSNILFIGMIVLLPCPVTMGKGLGLGVLNGNLGGGSPLAKIAATSAEQSAEIAKKTR